MNRPVKQVCAHCGSEALLMDAHAVWLVSTQEWVLNATFENFICESDECKGARRVHGRSR
jgi:hypothetical protein